jgi:hypothetical protein
MLAHHGDQLIEVAVADQLAPLEATPGTVVFLEGAPLPRPAGLGVAQDPPIDDAELTQRIERPLRDWRARQRQAEPGLGPEVRERARLTAGGVLDPVALVGHQQAIAEPVGEHVLHAVLVAGHVAPSALVVGDDPVEALEWRAGDQLGELLRALLDRAAKDGHA